MLKCIPIYSLYLEAGHTTTPGNWPRPEIYEDTTGTATVYHLSGPAEGAPLEPGQYEVKYRARDAADNVSPVCTILINVEGKLGLAARKTVFRGLRTSKAQTSLRKRAD